VIGSEDVNEANELFLDGEVGTCKRVCILGKTVSGKWEY
jgi:hypothetical protein